MGLKRSIYRALAISNDVNAVRKRRIPRRIARRVAGRATGKLFRRIFG